jgi:hypothetical protein
MTIWDREILALKCVLQPMWTLLEYPFKVFDLFPPDISLVFISALMGVILLKFYGFLSDQKKIRATKDQIKAHLLAIALYRDDIGVGLKSQGMMLFANLKYLYYNILPAIILILVCFPFLGHLNVRYGYESFYVGDQIKLTVYPDTRVQLKDIVITMDDDLKIISPPLRIDELHEVNWKLEATNNGKHKLKIQTESEIVVKEVVVGKANQVLSPYRTKSILKHILYSGEELLPRDSNFIAVRIAYPNTTINCLGYQAHWLVPFCVIAILSGLLFKRALNVIL